MLFVLALTVFFGIISPSITVDYTTETISASCTVFDNPFLFHTLSSNATVYLFDNYAVSTMYLNIPRQITTATTGKLRIYIKIKNLDGKNFYIMYDPMPLCDFLEEAMNNEDNIFNILRFSRVFKFNMVPDNKGTGCSIRVGKMELTQYIFPSHISMRNSIGCGLFFFTIILETCDESYQPCKPIIVANILANLQTKDFEKFDESLNLVTLIKETRLLLINKIRDIIHLFPIPFM